MNKKRSISIKVARHTLSITMLSIAAVSFIAGAGIGILRQNTITISESLGETAASASKEELENQAKRHLRDTALSKAELSDEKLMSIQKYVKMISDNATEIMSSPSYYPPFTVLPPDSANKGVYAAQLLHSEDSSYEELRKETDLLGNNSKLLLNIVENNDNITAAYTGTESGAIIIADKDSDIKSEIFDPRERDWYIKAKDNNSLIWTDVFEDRLGRGLAVTCAAPYYDAENNLCGVAGIGSLLTNLSDIIIDTEIGKTGFAFVLNNKGQVIISPHSESNDESNAVYGILFENGNENLNNTVLKMTAGESGIETVIISGTEYYMAYEPFNTMPWSVAAVITVEEALSPAYSLEKSIIGLKDNAVSNINITIIILFIILVIILSAVISTAAFMSGKMSKRLTGPITELTDGAKRIGTGDFSKKLKADTGDEIEILASTFNTMIDDIQTAATEKERIGAELDVAARIQESMLPCDFPAFPERAEFDVFASMNSAKEVGGDFYDFFLIDENTLAVIIADVSGKGVPAALFMVVAKTLIKSSAKSDRKPNEVFEEVNNLLCENNEARMFVTAFLGYLDISRGTFTYVNAGHNPPLIKNGGVFSELKTDTGFILAGVEDMRYKQGEVNLQSGDILFLYTDGLTEAMSINKELFGIKRLLKAVNECVNLPLNEFAASVKSKICSFAKDTEQSDDMTMLILRYNGGNKRTHLTRGNNE